MENVAEPPGAHGGMDDHGAGMMPMARRPGRPLRRPEHGTYEGHVLPGACVSLSCVFPFLRVAMPLASALEQCMQGMQGMQLQGWCIAEEFVSQDKILECQSQPGLGTYMVLLQKLSWEGLHVWDLVLQCRICTGRHHCECVLAPMH